MRRSLYRTPLERQSRRPRAPWRRLATAITVATACILGVGSPVLAQQNLFQVVVKVNDKIITGYDIAQRARLIKVAAPSRPDEAAARLAVDELINDELKLQEAERQGLELTDGDVQDAIISVAQSNNMSPEDFVAQLTEAGVSQAAFERQLRADIVWNQLLRRRFGDRVVPTEEEIAAEIDKSAGGGAERFDVRQIVVPLAPDAVDDLVRRAFEEAQRVRRELTDCSKIAALAGNYSRLSGEVGRLTAAQMPPPVRDAVVPLEVGEATQPLRSQDGVHIIMKCGVQTAATASRSQVYNRLLTQKAARFSGTYLDDLSRDAMIERRN